MEEFLNFLSVYGIYIALAIMIIVFFICIWIANSSMDNYVLAFEKYNQLKTSFIGSGLDFANTINILAFDGRGNIEINHDSKLSANGSYTPATKTITLSESITKNCSIATAGVIAHEFGHFAQHLSGNKTLTDNFKISLTVRKLGLLNFPLIAFFLIGLILGLVLSATEPVYSLVCFCVAVLAIILLLINIIYAICLKISTLKVEINASENAIKILTRYKLLKEEEIDQVKTFLQFAKKTYTGDLFCAVFAWTGLVRKTKFF